MRGWKLRLLALLLLLNLLSLDLNGQTPIPYSIVIDEILPDPAPAVGLPNAEFIELKNVSGNPINRRSHPSVTPSSSVAAGDVRQSIACWLSAADSKSARMPGALPVLAK